MPYDTILYGEAQAADGLTGFAALTGQNHAVSGDKITLLTDPEPPFLQGFGFLSDTKPQASALLPDKGNSNKPYYGPGGMDFWRNGWAQILRSIPIKLVKGDSITGQAANTNVNEGGIIGADIAYGNPIAPWDPAAFRTKYSKIFSELVTITSAAAVTFNSGAGALDAKTTNVANWLDPDANYDILGVLHHIGAATFGGMLNITKLAGVWQGKQPGIIVNPLSAVTFDAGEQFVPALEPIPFSGEAPPTVGMTATSAGAVNFALLMGQL